MKAYVGLRGWVGPRASLDAWGKRKLFSSY
jgi:hypothetical protein